MSKQKAESTYQEQLDSYLSLLTLLNESTDDFMYVLDIPKRCFHFSSPRVAQRFPVPSGSSTCSLQQWLELVHPQDRAEVARELEQVLLGEKELHDINYRLRTLKGRPVWINCRGKTISAGENRPAMMVGRISESAISCHFDSVTGLLYLESAEKSLQKAVQKGNGYLLILGVDNFKNLNDRHGRSRGNDVLHLLAGVLEENSRPGDTVFRLDGDKFGLLLPHYHREQVDELFQNIQLEFMTYMAQCLSDCTLSGGAVAYPEDAADYNQLYQYAESALTYAKKQGKNTLRFFSISDYHQQLFLLDLREELLESIRNNFEGFEVYYQPQVDLSTGKVTGAEALMRWNSPHYGSINPNVFIPILEQSKNILEAGRWILHKALSQCAEWRRYLPHFHMSINLSYIQLKSNVIVPEVLQALEETGLPGSAVVLELTESVQLQNFPYYNHIFGELMRHGIQIAIDDFGTGYSSLQYLKQLQVNEIKIDRCFVEQIQNGQYNFMLIRNIIELAHSIDMRVCVEGVEKREELETLAKLSPDLIQGYFFGHPIQAPEFFQKHISSCGSPDAGSAPQPE